MSWWSHELRIRKKVLPAHFTRVSGDADCRKGKEASEEWGSPGLGGDSRIGSPVVARRIYCER